MMGLFFINEPLINRSKNKCCCFYRNDKVFKYWLSSATDVNCFEIRGVEVVTKIDFQGSKVVAH